MKRPDSLDARIYLTDATDMLGRALKENLSEPDGREYAVACLRQVSINIGLASRLLQKGPAKALIRRSRRGRANAE